MLSKVDSIAWTARLLQGGMDSALIFAEKYTLEDERSRADTVSEQLERKLAPKCG